MDQPNNEQSGNDSTNMNMEGVNEANAVPVVDTASQYQEDMASGSSNDAMEGMNMPESTSVDMPEAMPEPEAVDTTPEQFQQAVVEAEQNVAEASPQAASEELADVASELKALETQNFDADTGPNTSQGTDPMQQIQQNEAEHPVNYGENPQPEMAQESVTVESTPPVAEYPETPVVTETEYAASANETAMASSAEQYPATPTPQPGQLINDVIAPAAATAAATSYNTITGTPEPAPSETAAMGAMPEHKTEKSKKGLLILIVILVTLLFGGAAVAAYLSSSKTDDSASTQTSESILAQQEAETTNPEPTEDEVIPAQTAQPGEDVKATTLDDYKVACGQGKVLNAAAYTGKTVHPIVMFEKGSDDKFAQNVLPFKDKTWTSVSSDVTSSQLVGCISMVETSAKKLKSCPITDPATKVTSNVDFYSTSYSVGVYEALTGKVVGTFDTASTDTECPTTAIYNKADPKIYAGYDVMSIETALKEYVTKAL